MSLSARTVALFWRDQDTLPRSELAHLKGNYGIARVEKVVMVGGGAIPYTALFASRHLHKPTYIIERNLACYLACLRLLRKLKAPSDVRVIRGEGQHYWGYRNSLVIVALHVCKKQEVVNSAMKGEGNIVIVRQPTRKYADLFESVNAKNNCTCVHHKAVPPLTSIFIA